MTPLDRLIRTLAPLPINQLVQLARQRALPPGRPGTHVRLHRRPWLDPWKPSRWRQPVQDADGSFIFLNKRSSTVGPALWRDAAHGRLWLYQLHYLDDLDAKGVDDHQKRSLLENWIANNPPFSGTGWEPYPLSLRIVNIVKFLSASPGVPTVETLSSLGLQVLTLEKRIEHHLRANHLFENGKALVFAGVFLDGKIADRWLTAGLDILDGECAEQFLPDGGHFELSPMYHGTMLWGLCDLVALANSAGMQPLIDRRPRWQQLLREGYKWYHAMTHPDGEISFFNDAAFGQAPNLAAVRRYLDDLRIDVSQTRATEDSISATTLSASGYFRIDHGPSTATILDAARVGPDYQPAHAHADTLSFELSAFGQRVVVNSGTSTYDKNAQREIERGTAAHNTVVIDGLNSSDTWAAFRVGRRAAPQVTKVESDGRRVVIEASHDGYRRWSGGASHHRRWIGSVGRLYVGDRIEGEFRSAFGYFHFHPDVQVKASSEAGSFTLKLADGRPMWLKVSTGQAELLPSTWHPEFGRSVPNQLLRVRFDGRQAEAEFCW